MTATSASHKSHVDIVGAGSAGLMLALWMARLGIKTRDVDKRTDKVSSGQADGFQVRTLEILDGFGIGECEWEEANHMIDSREVSFWNPNENGKIRRDVRMPNSTSGLSRFTQCVVRQGRMENVSARRHPRLEAMTSGPASLAYDEDAYPIEVTLRHLTEEATPAQRLSNVGDGLHRSTLADDTGNILERSALGTEQRLEEKDEQVRARFLVGCDGAHSGVLDVVPITDFPDIRNRCMVRTAGSGTITASPRHPGGHPRGYAEDPEPVQYTISYHCTYWWTAYRIDRGSADPTRPSYAVYTHPPKAGLGMNTSTQDTYSLGWKLGLVCNKVARRGVLSTYELERRQVAEQLVAFDQQFASMWPAANCKPGTRFASHKVLNQADPRPWELHHLMPSDGRFRVGDVSRHGQLVNGLGGWLTTELLLRHPRMGAEAGLIEVLLVYAARREEIELLTDLHELYHPWDAKLGWYYDKTFIDGPSYHEDHGRACEGYGVDADGGRFKALSSGTDDVTGAAPL
ncbi:FAD binding domain-containing protein [Hirsutella rhossiliensis]|uniref:FAD binding domain-containing protein n=1 Tax=Hirsutella rhossiliensis TaxID=111463 RepID=A0A9P8SKD5_9HYPO|nr:FAD binding domain-containing protein [Hirsutella rhossiliensis]KAH0964625.1 FAD binding domain-containing protein [Hirsutella rhossiliensis]